TVPSEIHARIVVFSIGGHFGRAAPAATLPLGAPSIFHAAAYGCSNLGSDALRRVSSPPTHIVYTMAPTSRMSRWTTRRQTLPLDVRPQSYVSVSGGIRPSIRTAWYPPRHHHQPASLSPMTPLNHRFSLLPLG
ncbi:hypothetical protein BV898_20047, partial [Hypsibius exemplaris]